MKLINKIFGWTCYTDENEKWSVGFLVAFLVMVILAVAISLIRQALA